MTTHEALFAEILQQLSIPPDVDLWGRQMSQLIADLAIAEAKHKHLIEGENMIEVGKIVIREATSTSYDSTPEESIAIGMDTQAISLQINRETSSRDRMYDDKAVRLSAEQAIELGTFLLKAAEVLPEYAGALKEIDDQRIKLVEKYKDQISGLGLVAEVDVVDTRGTFKVIEASDV